MRIAKNPLLPHHVQNCYSSKLQTIHDVSRCQKKWQRSLPPHITIQCQTCNHNDMNAHYTQEACVKACTIVQRHVLPYHAGSTQNACMHRKTHITLPCNICNACDPNDQILHGRLQNATQRRSQATHCLTVRKTVSSKSCSNLHTCHTPLCHIEVTILSTTLQLIVRNLRKRTMQNCISHPRTETCEGQHLASPDHAASKQHECHTTYIALLCEIPSDNI